MGKPIIPLLNEDGTDLSIDMYLQVGLVLEMLTACQYICNCCGRSYDMAKYKDVFFQQKRQTVNELQRAFKRVCIMIDRNFDGVLQKIWAKFPGESGKAYESLQTAAIEDLRMLLIFNTRCNGDVEKMRKMQKALLNFNASNDSDYDLDALLKYYNLE